MTAPTVNQFIDVAEFRAALQHFQRESQRITGLHGLTPQRYLLLLMIQGAPDRTERSTVTQLSQRLQLAQHTVTELVARSVRAGLIRRTVSVQDRRVVHLSLTATGKHRLVGTFNALVKERHALMALLAKSRV
jgi:DNA-binding MarR family transcriptional regulator